MSGDATESRKMVLLTGAAGKIGRVVRVGLRPDYRLRLVDRRPLEGELQRGEEEVRADIEDFPVMERAMQGVAAVVHLAGMPTPEYTWEEVLHANIIGTYNVFEAARRAGVGKIVFASTGHVMGMYTKDDGWPIRPEQPVRPDSYYGYYSDAFGMSMICLRIGWFLERPHVAGALSGWLSPADTVQLVRRSIESNVRFGLYWGVSNNTRCHWDTTNVRRELGYDPVDNAEDYAHEILGTSP
jgi:hypothetical protein